LLTLFQAEADLIVTLRRSGVNSEKTALLLAGNHIWSGIDD